MARVKTYTEATSVTATDKILGTDSSNSDVSSNLVASDIADYIGVETTQSITQDAGLYAFDSKLGGFNISTTDYSQVLTMTLSPSGLSLPDMIVTAQAKAKYVGTTSRLFQITLTTNLVILVGSPTFFRSRVYVNDAYLPNTESVTPISGLNNSLHSLAIPVILNEGDYFDMRFAVDTGTVGTTDIWTNIFSVASYSTT